MNVAEAAIFRGADEDGRQRINFVLYGPPSEEEWLNDPRAIASQQQLMAMSGGPDAEMGEAP